MGDIDNVKIISEQDRVIASMQVDINHLEAEVERLRELSTGQWEVVESEKLEQLRGLLDRWVNIAENGGYGTNSRYPLNRHPLVEETRRALVIEQITLGRDK